MFLQEIKSKYPGEHFISRRYSAIIPATFRTSCVLDGHTGGITHITATVCRLDSLWKIFMNQPLNRNIPPQH